MAKVKFKDAGGKVKLQGKKRDLLPYLGSVVHTLAQFKKIAGDNSVLDLDVPVNFTATQKSVIGSDNTLLFSGNTEELSEQIASVKAARLKLANK